MKKSILKPKDKMLLSGGRQPYNSAFNKKMKISKREAKEGKTVKVNLDDIWN